MAPTTTVMAPAMAAAVWAVTATTSAAPAAAAGAACGIRPPWPSGALPGSSPRASSASASRILRMRRAASCMLITRSSIWTSASSLATPTGLSASVVALTSRPTPSIRSRSRLSCTRSKSSSLILKPWNARPARSRSCADFIRLQTASCGRDSFATSLAARAGRAARATSVAQQLVMMRLLQRGVRGDGRAGPEPGEG